MDLRRDVFQAISDPTRRQIIDILSGKSLNLNAVSSHFNISRPAISKHIKILTECGLVIVRREGRERYCSADVRRLSEVDQWLNQHKKFWNNKLDALGGFLERDNDQVSSEN